MATLHTIVETRVFSLLKVVDMQGIHPSASFICRQCVFPSQCCYHNGRSAASRGLENGLCIVNTCTFLFMQSLCYVICAYSLWDSELDT